MTGMTPKNTSGTLWGTKVKMFCILYIFELGIIRKYGRKGVGDVGKAPKKLL
jgi:hypothetical protein